MEQLITDRLQENLSRLKLTKVAEVLGTIVERAETDKSSYLAFLDHLLEEEVAAKDTRRIQTAMKTAGLPVAKSIEEYDFSSSRSSSIQNLSFFLLVLLHNPVDSDSFLVCIKSKCHRFSN